MPDDVLASLGFVKIVTHAGDQHSLLDETCPFLVIRLVPSDVFAFRRQAMEEGPLASLANLVHVSSAATG